MSIRSLIACVVLVVSASAQAYSLSDIQGKWSSTKVYSKNSSADPTAGQFDVGMVIEFGQQHDFSLTRTMTYKNGDVFVQKFSGTYALAFSEILTEVTSTEMTYHGQTSSAPVQPNSGLIMTVISVGSNAMILQMGKEDLYLDLQRVP